MKALIVFASTFGNTQKIAEAMYSAFKSKSSVKLLPFQKVDYAQLKSVKLLVVGSPTQGGAPTPDLQKYLNQIPENFLKGIQVAAFDTRYSESDQNIAVRLLMKTIGYAAPKIMDILKVKGGEPISPPQGFYVRIKEGSLKPGEETRAITWIKNIYGN